MAIKNYFTKFYKQKYVEVPGTGAPPWDAPTWKWADDVKVPGIFTQQQSGKLMVADAQTIHTHGRFATAADASISPGDTLRCATTDKFFSIESDPVTAPPQAMTQIKVYAAKVVNRPPQGGGEM